MSQVSKSIYGIVKRNEKSYWTRIGTAFVNRDGSLNLKLDFLPSDMSSITIQVRDDDREKEAMPAEPTVVASA